MSATAPSRPLTLVLAASALVGGLIAAGCTRPLPKPDLGARYAAAAKYHGPDRNPVIVMPGILGSRLVDSADGSLIWGAFTGKAANPARDEVSRKISLPMREGVPLSGLSDTVQAEGSLDRLRLKLFGLPVELNAYAQILATLGVGGYRDQQLAEAGAIDYGTDHYTCFQFAYDWRRDNVETARELYRDLQYKRTFVQEGHAKRYGGKPGDYDVKFDIVAHSMGGLVLRYMLRFGDAPLPADGSLPPVTWAGAELVDRAVLVGTPNAGAPSAFLQLRNGIKFSPFHGKYSAAVLGTMPSIYQLLPRDRHRRVEIDPATDSLEDPAVWSKFGWGLADPDRISDLRVLLPDAADDAERLRIATDHLTKCVVQATRFHAALDQSAEKPEGLSLVLYAGDGLPTPDRIELNPWGDVTQVHDTLGDGTVPLASTVFDERVGGDWSPVLTSPIPWNDVNFLIAEHLGLTSDAVFANNLLFLLLEGENASGERAAE